MACFTFINFTFQILAYAQSATVILCDIHKDCIRVTWILQSLPFSLFHWSRFNHCSRHGEGKLFRISYTVFWLNFLVSSVIHSSKSYWWPHCRPGFPKLQKCLRFKC